MPHTADPVVEYVESTQLGGIKVAIRRGPSSDASKPTLIMLHSLATDGNLYRPQFSNESLTSSYNLVAVDLFGHGHTGGLAPVVTYWDHAKIILDVIHALSLTSVSILGTSQGGFIAARVALLEPAVVKSLILCGTSLYSETSRLGSWDIEAVLAGAIPYLSQPTAEGADEFVLPQPFTDDVVGSGLGPRATNEQKVYVREIHERVYRGEEGRERYLMILNTLRQRDTLSPTQLSSLTCAISVLHGTEDVVYSVPLMQEWASALVNAGAAGGKGAGGAEVHVIDKGQHFLTASDPIEVDRILVEFMKRVEGSAKL